MLDLYDAWHEAEPAQGHDAQAAQWRAKLEEEGTKGQRDHGTEGEQPASQPSLEGADPQDSGGE